jgi:bacteriorhodopsin
MTVIASALVNWHDLWEIILTALVGGTGVVILFGVLLLGISRGGTAVTSTARHAFYALSGVCGAVVVAVAVIGIYAMTQKPSSAPLKAKAVAVHPEAPSRAHG